MVQSLTHIIPLLWHDKRLRYFIIGGGNTIFGYMASVGLYYGLTTYLHIVAIGIISSIVNISFSFLTYKLLVFKTKGAWFSEYLRCYAVYGLSLLMSICSLWIIVDYMHISFWIAQAGIIFVSAILSYIGHSAWTFARKNKA